VDWEGYRKGSTSFAAPLAWPEGAITAAWRALDTPAGRPRQSQPVARWLRISTEHPPLVGAFGSLDHERTGEVLAQLKLAEDRLMSLRDTLAERTGRSWTCYGVQLVASDRFGSGSIRGWVEGDAGVTFSAELTPRWDTRGWRPGDPWQVGKDAWDLEAEITVYTDENRDRAGDVVREFPERRYLSPEDAAAGFAAICAELAEAALSRPPDAASWLGEGEHGAAT
jgi:hypothetical protein